MRALHILITITVLSVLLVAGCSDDNKDTNMTVATQSPTATPSLTQNPTPTPISTPIRTTVPVATATPTPISTEDPTMVKLADGFYYIEIDDEIKTRITGMSYPADDTHAGISYDDLRYIRLLHYDFDGNIKTGELIVNEAVADEVMQIFLELYQAKYPLTSVILVDDYGEPGDDNLSMAANNTSAFNYRHITGSSKLSRHSYGAAIDINPMMNPYIDGDRIAPPNGEVYADRSMDLEGMIDHDDLCYKLFIENGWSWGGDWRGDKDYQHFSKDLGY